VGPPGPTGPTGPAGPVGATGATGPQGIPGNLALANQTCPLGQSLRGYDAAGGLVCSGSVAAFSGVQVNTPISALTGWTQCYLDTYANSSTSLATILAACDKANLLLGCRATGSPTLITFAHAPRADVIFETGTGANSTHAANNVAWYFNNSWSWGYLPAGQTANRNSCDTNNIGSGDRLCYHTGGGNINAGYRCGSNTSFSTAFERIIFHAN
jgi:hypothetical protein